MSAHARAHKQAFNKSRSVGRGQKKGILVRVAYLMSWVQSAVAVNRAKGGGAVLGGAVTNGNETMGKSSIHCSTFNYNFKETRASKF